MSESVAILQKNYENESLKKIDSRPEQISEIRKEVEQAAGTNHEKAFQVYQNAFSPPVIDTVLEPDAFTEEYTNAIEKDLDTRQNRALLTAMKK